MEWYSILLMAILALMLIYTLYREFSNRKKKDRVLTQLSKALLSKDFDTYDKLLFENQKLFSVFNRSLMMLQANIAKDDYAEVNDNIKAFLEVKLTGKQKQIVFNIAFNYYMSKEKYKSAKACLNKLRETDDAYLIHNSEIMYNTFAEKGHKYLDELLDIKEEDLDEETKIRNEYLISEMYKNKGNLKLSDSYRQKYENSLNNLNK